MFTRSSLALLALAALLLAHVVLARRDTVSVLERRAIHQDTIMQEGDDEEHAQAGEAGSNPLNVQLEGEAADDASSVQDGESEWALAGEEEDDADELTADADEFASTHEDEEDADEHEHAEEENEWAQSGDDEVDALTGEEEAEEHEVQEDADVYAAYGEEDENALAAEDEPPNLHGDAEEDALEEAEVLNNPLLEGEETESASTSGGGSTVSDNPLFQPLEGSEEVGAESELAVSEISAAGGNTEGAANAPSVPVGVWVGVAIGAIVLAAVVTAVIIVVVKRVQKAKNKRLSQTASVEYAQLQ